MRDSCNDDDDDKVATNGHDNDGNVIATYSGSIVKKETTDVKFTLKVMSDEEIESDRKAKVKAIEEKKKADEEWDQKVFAPFRRPVSPALAGMPVSQAQIAAGDASAFLRLQKSKLSGHQSALRTQALKEALIKLRTMSDSLSIRTLKLARKRDQLHREWEINDIAGKDQKKFLDRRTAVLARSAEVDRMNLVSSARAKYYRVIKTLCDRYPVQNKKMLEQLNSDMVLIEADIKDGRARIQQAWSETLVLQERSAHFAKLIQEQKHVHQKALKQMKAQNKAIRERRLESVLLRDKDGDMGEKEEAALKKKAMKSTAKRGLTGVTRHLAAKNAVDWLSTTFKGNADLIARFDSLGARGPAELVERFLNRTSHEENLNNEIEQKKERLQELREEVSEIAKEYYATMQANFCSSPVIPGLEEHLDGAAAKTLTVDDAATSRNSSGRFMRTLEDNVMNANRRLDRRRDEYVHALKFLEGAMLGVYHVSHMLSISAPETMKASDLVAQMIATIDRIMTAIVRQRLRTMENRVNAQGITLDEALRSSRSRKVSTRAALRRATFRISSIKKMGEAKDEEKVSKEFDYQMKSMSHAQSLLMQSSILRTQSSAAPDTPGTPANEKAKLAKQLGIAVDDVDKHVQDYKQVPSSFPTSLFIYF